MFALISRFFALAMPLSPWLRLRLSASSLDYDFRQLLLFTPRFIDAICRYLCRCRAAGAAAATGFAAAVIFRRVF